MCQIFINQPPTTIPSCALDILVARSRLVFNLRSSTHTNVFDTGVGISVSCCDTQPLESLFTPVLSQGLAPLSFNPFMSGWYSGAYYLIVELTACNSCPRCAQDPNISQKCSLSISSTSYISPSFLSNRAVLATRAANLAYSPERGSPFTYTAFQQWPLDKRRENSAEFHAASSLPSIRYLRATRPPLALHHEAEHLLKPPSIFFKSIKP